jgi:hypothetical protein
LTVLHQEHILFTAGQRLELNFEFIVITWSRKVSSRVIFGSRVVGPFLCL